MKTFNNLLNYDPSLFERILLDNKYECKVEVVKELSEGSYEKQKYSFVSLPNDLFLT